jgi:hypothetical protein
MPCSILPQVAEASAARASKQLNHKFYDFQTLRDSCGCLIRVNVKTQQVTFAHYTVQEYLHRTHIYQGVSETLAHPFFLDFICTETLRIHQEDLGSTQEGNFQHKDFAIDSQMNGNLHIYCATSSMLSLNEADDWIHQRNVSLVVDLLDPSKDHIDVLWRVLDIAYVAQRSSRGLVTGGLYCVKRFWQVGWDPNLDTYHVEALHLLNCVFAITDAADALVLVEHVLRSKRPGSGVFEAELAITVPTRRDSDRIYEADSGRKKICGTMMTILPQLGIRRDAHGYLDYGYLNVALKVFHYLLQQDIVEKIKACDIIICTASHYHFTFCRNFCPLEHLLSNGGDPNGSGYRITPLQIATHKHDSIGVNILLKAGADPNGTGDRNGKVWKADEPLSYYNILIGASPLRISKNQGSKYRASNYADSSRIGLLKIRSALLQHGARSFMAGMEDDAEDDAEEDAEEDPEEDHEEYFGEDQEEYFGEGHEEYFGEDLEEDLKHESKRDRKEFLYRIYGFPA